MNKYAENPDRALVKNEPKIIRVGSDTYECEVDPALMPAIERHLHGSTTKEFEIRKLDISSCAATNRFAIRLIRLYRTHISPRLGQRCRFDPSCSHYAELLYFQKGVLQATKETIRRIYQCSTGKTQQ